MKKDRKYVFRDNEELLKKLDKGTRSKFIRKAIKTQILLNKSVYEEEIVEINELITFYNKCLKIYDEELEQLDKECKNIKRQKKRVKDKLEKITRQQNNRKSILQQQIIIKRRQALLDRIINNLVQDRKNKTIRSLDLNYLVHMGGYKNKKELKLHLRKYIDSLKESDPTGYPKILKKDVEY